MSDDLELEKYEMKLQSREERGGCLLAGPRLAFIAFMWSAFIAFDIFAIWLIIKLLQHIGAL